ncbi:hypothetical protein ACQ5SO_04980 [Rhodovulum sp. DZ06]|uniref:hypothetical protein n=1 Tax=Rhodovulum sp. DZ06 TaxID=3425126 RepID=UPI003D3376ED
MQRQSNAQPRETTRHGLPALLADRRMTRAQKERINALADAARRIDAKTLALELDGGWVEIDLDGGADAPDPLAAARARGAEAAARILAGPGMLTGAELGARMGKSRQAVDLDRKAGRLFALSGGARRLRYPDWQIDATGAPLPGLSEVIAALGDGWAAWRFLGGPGADGAPRWQALARGETDGIIAEAAARGHAAFG